MLNSCIVNLRSTHIPGYYICLLNAIQFTRGNVHIYLCIVINDLYLLIHTLCIVKGLYTIIDI